MHKRQNESSTVVTATVAQYRLYLSTVMIQKMMMLVLGKENAVLLCFSGWQSKSGTFVRFHGTWPFSAIGDAAKRK